MQAGQAWVLTISIIYLAALLFIGYLYSGRMKSMDDFATAGRMAGGGLPLVAVAASLLATNNDTGNVLGIPEMTYGAGFGGIFWISTLCLIVYLLMFVLGPRMQQAAATTLPDLVFKRYGNSHRVRVVTTLWSIVNAVVFMGVQLYGVAVIIEAIFGVPWQYSLIPIAAVVIIYTAMGGLWAVAFTDVIQWGIIMLGTALVIPLLYLTEGSFSAVVLANQPSPGYASLNPGMPTLQLLGLGLAASLWILADPALTQRFISADSTRSARRGVWLWVLIIYPWWLMMGAIGMFARVLLPDIPAAQALVLLVDRLFHPVLAAIVFVAVLGAAQSTADSYLNVVSSMFVNDIYRPYIRKDATERHYITVARWGTIATGVLGLLIAPVFSQGIFVMALTLQMIFISSVVPIVVLGLLSKRVTEPAAFWASLLGGIVCVVWLILGGSEGLWGIQPIYPALGLALIVIGAGALTSRPETGGHAA